ncbi:hypothetical protein KHS38_13915 [Mucilaginibacter sp. Bleaf8]|uniref:hypothetical protein n=1 Tax=Mucilaginibacter sp. Bleaf8 TaxID=2834430 RepID=UPI001BCF1CEE|nr:hypothetical protein [Mucilaginibacter sp. Bleaf8]MBS7565504.1 hypothetical protein [Mucilaginibacter sp. Bleaf8]
MEITDLKGQRINVPDLELAILQADDYRHYRHADPAYAASDQKLQAYWEDMYQKLLALRA